MDIFYILLYNIIIILKYFYYFYYSIIQLFLFFSLKPIHYYNSKFESIYFIHLLSGIFLLERHNNKNLPLLQSPTCNIILFNVTFSAMCYYSYNYTSSRNNQQTRIFFRGQILKRLILLNITYLNYYYYITYLNYYIII